MVRQWLKYVIVGSAVGILAAPALALAQEECAQGGNQYTRAAEVELTWAQKPDDPQSKETRYERALEKLGEAIALNPELSRAYLLAGESYIGLRDFEGADSVLTKLIQMEPGCQTTVETMRFNAWVPWYNRGLNLLSQGDEAEALASFEKANVIYEDARSLNNAAAIYQRKGENGPAIDLYRRALETGGEPDMVRVASINVAELLRLEGRDEEALQLYADYAARHPDDILGRLNYAIALMDAGQQEAAQEMFTELLEREDLNFRQWSQVGIGLYRAGNYAEAQLAFERAHRLQPYNKETLENLANTYYHVEAFEQLRAIADTLVARYPYETGNYNLLANAHSELQNPDGALAVLERRDALAFEFLRAQLVPQGENGYVVDGQVMNKSGAAGTEVSVPLELLGEQGNVVLNENLLLTLPEQGEAASFQLQLQLQEPIAGFQYRLASGS